MRNYISKINDRNLQRKRESGITTYVLYSVLIIVLYKISEQYPLIPFKANFWLVTTILGYTFNIFLSLFLVYIIYSVTIGNFTSIRLIHKPSQDESFFENIIELLIIIIPTITNVAICTYLFFIVDRFNLYFFVTSLLLLFLIVIFIIDSFRQRKVSNTYEVLEGTGKVGSDKNFKSILSYCLFVTFIGLSLFLIFNESTILGKLNIFIFGVLFYSIPYILIRIIELRKKDNFSVALENLEYEINVRNLTDAQIRDRLQKNYMGFLLIEWIDYNLKELEEFKQKIEQEKVSIDTLNKDLKNIDAKLYPIEYKGRKEKIEGKEKFTINEIQSFFNGKLNEIASIWGKGELETNERNELRKLYIKMKSELAVYEKK